VLDLQVIAGQTVAVGQRLGTIGRMAGGGASLKAVSYFAPADARRLRNGMPVEVIPQWNQRSRFGGIVGKVLQVNTLSATEEDISTRQPRWLPLDPLPRQRCVSGAGGTHGGDPCLRGVAHAPLLHAAGSAFDHRWLPHPCHQPHLEAGLGAWRSRQLVKAKSRDRFRRELPWLVAEVVLLVVITHAFLASSGVPTPERVETLIVRGIGITV
jgi:hypothetical protein